MSEATYEEKLQIAKQYEALEKSFRLKQKEVYSKDFYYFSRDVLGWPDIYEPLHQKVCDFVQDNVDNHKLLILLPRGTFKSSIVTIGYTLWRICKNPNERIMIGNATYPMAVSFLKQIKDQLGRNEELKAIYGDLGKDADSWRDDQITLSGEITKGSKGYRGKEPTVSVYGTGSNLTGSHFTLAILDDMVNRENIGTKDQIQKVINFYKDTLDLVDISGSGHKQVIVIGTTWHQADLYSWIQDKETGIIDDFKVLCMPAYEGEWLKGKLLFPRRLGWKQLEELKRQQGSSHFSAQYLLDPVPLETATFRGDFRYYEAPDIKNVPGNIFIAVDPAISEKKEADYSAMVCVKVDKNNDWYILDLWRDKVNPKRLIDQIFYWDEKWKPNSIGVETVSFQKALQFYIYEEMKRRNRFLPIKELRHSDRSKDERIRGLEPRYETGSIFHNKLLTLNEILEDELRRFPRGKNDDLLDSLASLLELAFPPRKREERKRKKWKRVYDA